MAQDSTSACVPRPRSRPSGCQAVYLGIDAEHIQAAIDEATWQKLFADVSPEDLASKGRPFPIGPYFDDILEAYEKQVEN